MKDKNGKPINIGDYVCYKIEKYIIFDNETYTSIKKLNGEEHHKVNIKFIEDKLTKIPLEYMERKYPEYCI